MVSASRQSPGSHARSDVPSSSYPRFVPHPRFAQAIHGLSAQSAIHGLRKTIHGWSRSTVCAEQIHTNIPRDVGRCLALSPAKFSQRKKSNGTKRRKLGLHCKGTSAHAHTRDITERDRRPHLIGWSMRITTTLHHYA